MKFESDPNPALRQTESKPTDLFRSGELSLG